MTSTPVYLWTHSFLCNSTSGAFRCSEGIGLRLTFAVGYVCSVMHVYVYVCIQKVLIYGQLLYSTSFPRADDGRVSIALPPFPSRLDPLTVLLTNFLSGFSLLILVILMPSLPLYYDPCSPPVCCSDVLSVVGHSIQYS